MTESGPTMEASLNTFRAPPFCNHDPSMWFSLLECGFMANKITKSLTKFLHTTSLLPPDVLSQVSDVIATAAQSETPYEDLKTAILTRLQSSVTARLQELLSKEELGNEKPSDLLRRMKKLLGESYRTFDQTLFHHLFYQRLPPSIQRNLFSVKSKLTIEELAELADEFMTSIPSEPVVQNISPVHSSRIGDLLGKISQLTQQVHSLQEQFSRRSQHQNRSTSRHRCRSKSPRRAANSFCYYHRKYGANAYRCTKPCAYKQPKDNGEH